LEKKETIPVERLPKFLLGAGRLAWVNGELATSRSFFQQGLSLAVELGDRYNEAWLLIYFASCSIDQPDEYEEAVKQCKQGLAMFRDLNEKPGIAQGLNILGELARAIGDYSRAGQIYEETMLASQETGETYRQIMALSNLAFVAIHDGDYVRAKDLELSAIKRWREVGSWHGVTTSMAFLAGSLARLGEPEKAARLLGAAETLLAWKGFDFHMSDQHEIAKYRADVHSKLDEASFETAYAEGQAMTLEQAVAYALDE
jgi:tetratricopeptide (TPR) repeat protein